MLGAFLSRSTGSLFFLFWEAMLVPMCLLIGIRGGGRAAILLRDQEVLSLHSGGRRRAAARDPPGIYFCAHRGDGRLQLQMSPVSTNSRYRWRGESGSSSRCWLASPSRFRCFRFTRGCPTPMPMLRRRDPSSSRRCCSRWGRAKRPSASACRSSRRLRGRFIPVVAGLSIVAIVYGALLAHWRQTDWKRVIACSSISQMGTITLGLVCDRASCTLGAPAAARSTTRNLDRGARSS